MNTSTLTSRRIIVETAQGEYLTHLGTDEFGTLPLTNPGHFAAGLYRGEIHVVEGTATIHTDTEATT